MDDNGLCARELKEVSQVSLAREKRERRGRVQHTSACRTPHHTFPGTDRYIELITFQPLIQADWLIHNDNLVVSS